MLILLQKKKFREAVKVAERTNWIVLLMLVKRKTRRPKVKPSPILQEKVETQNMEIEIDGENAGRIADSSTKRESGELSR